MAEAIYARQMALQNPETLATLVHAIVRQKYGEESYEWDPLTVYLETQADYRADMVPETLDRWGAIQVIMTTDAFFKRLDAFLGICNTLASGSPSFESFNPVSLEEAAWAITEVALNRELLPFSYPIRMYLKRLLVQDGFDEGDYPFIFEEVFSKAPSSKDVRTGLAAINNSNNIDAFIQEQLADLVSQFNRIPDMSSVDNIIMARGFEEAMR